MVNHKRTDFPFRKQTVLFAVLLVLFTLSPLLGQFPDEFENLKILPEDIGSGELRDIMRSFSTALGVGCVHCHVPQESGRQRYDFASDEEPAKKTARVMIQMVKAINETHLAKLGRESGPDSPKVQCVSCHQGRSEPHLLADVLAEAHAEDGVKAALSKYQEWRQGYNDGLNYVQDRTLASFSQQLAVTGNPEDAIEILNSNLELHPRSASSYLALGEIYRLQRKMDLAKENFEKVLELDPENRRARARLRQLSGQRRRRR